MYEYCIKCGKKLDCTADDMQKGLCSQCRWETDNPLQNKGLSIPPISTNLTEKKLNTIINQLDTIIDVLYEIRNRK